MEPKDSVQESALEQLLAAPHLQQSRRCFVFIPPRKSDPQFDADNVADVYQAEINLRTPEALTAPGILQDFSASPSTSLFDDQTCQS